MNTNPIISFPAYIKPSPIRDSIINPTISSTWPSFLFFSYKRKTKASFELSNNSNNSSAFLYAFNLYVLLFGNCISKSELMLLTSLLSNILEYNSSLVLTIESLVTL